MVAQEAVLQSIRMPIFEYACRSCRHRLEAIVRAGVVPTCPACGAGDLDKLISSFAVDSPTSRGLSMSAIRKKNAGISKEKAWEDANYDRKHRHEDHD
jgi:putative FmdB family regulatory protein